MEFEAGSFDRLVAEFSKFPGIGRKTAQRMAFYLMKADREEATSLARAIEELKENIRYCSVCHNITESDPCRICANPGRDRSTICVVEEPSDVYSIERTGQYKGLYHVLGGALSPLDGVGPDDLRIKELIKRLEGEQVQEVILATNPDTEGEATATYLFRLIGPLGIKVTRIARGIPVGGDLEFADEVTLARALEGRKELG